MGAARKRGGRSLHARRPSGLPSVGREPEKRRLTALPQRRAQFREPPPRCRALDWINRRFEWLYRISRAVHRFEISKLFPELN